MTDVELVTAPGSEYGPEFDQPETLPILPNQPGPHAIPWSNGWAFSYTVWVVFKGENLNLCDFKRYVNMTGKETVNGTLTTVHAQGAGYDGKLSRSNSRPDGPNNVTDVWHNGDETVVVFMDAPMVGTTRTDTRRKVNNMPVAIHSPVPAARFSVDYRWHFLFEATQRRAIAGWGRGELVASITYSVVLKLPESRGYTQAEVKNQTAGGTLEVVAEEEMALIISQAP